MGNGGTRAGWVCLSSCDRTLDVQTAFPFEVETMPVRKEIAVGETAGVPSQVEG